MKKLLVLFSSLVLLTACGNEENETVKNEVKSPENKKADCKKEQATKESMPQPTEAPATNEYNQQYDQIEIYEQSQHEYTQEASQNVGQQVSNEYTPQQSNPIQENSKPTIDLNSLPPTDFSTEGMSEQAKKQIEELTIQKDFQGLPQEVYNDKVSEIINNENQIY
ncbi:hypothetical protein [Staphylococcus delphini]|uniref:hypothetical protein n=1 Tax=Staphylococcus delphini TaxID=53344 RepID=UPI0021CDEF86|nr:hypothetical protein [Staphylococcus delphini]UXS20690.1 hypothetical protein MUA22_07565 [Staphylococcus delphini]UXS56695.1 hypothetical protein MUA44_07560 [Staphylococcus delphini]